MTRSAALSRRGLLSLGLGAIPRPTGPGYHERQRTALERWSGDDLGTKALRRVADVADIRPGATVRAGGALGRWAAARGAVVTEPGAEPPELDHVLIGFELMFTRDVPSALEGLVRLLGPGGSLAFCVWTGGPIAELLRLAARLDPSPVGTPSPRTWGREERLRAELEGLGCESCFDLLRLQLIFASQSEAADRLLAGLPSVAAVPERERMHEVVGELVDTHGRQASGAIELETSCTVVTAFPGRQPG